MEDDFEDDIVKLHYQRVVFAYWESMIDFPMLDAGKAMMFNHLQDLYGHQNNLTNKQLLRKLAPFKIRLCLDN